MRRFIYLFILLPLVIVVVVLAVANRSPVTFSLDPLGAPPALAWTAPLFILLFAALALGIVIGGIATWISQGKWRHMARDERAHARRLQQDAERARAAAAPTPRLPASRDAA